jgi:dihydrolipoamide dehydrogenase
MKKNKIDVHMGFGKLKAKGQIEVTAADGTKKVVEAKISSLQQVAAVVNCRQ